MTFGDVLARLRTRIVPMRGSKRLSGAIDSQFIFHYTSASVVVCLDRVRTDPIDQVKAEAYSLFEQGQIPQALKKLEQAAARKDNSNEETEAYLFLRQALATRNQDRIDIVGLRQPDIIYYLPVRSFHPQAETWHEVQQEYEASRRSDENMKTWLQRVHQARTSVKALRRAAELLDDLTEFTDLRDRIEVAATRRGGRPPSA